MQRRVRLGIISRLVKLEEERYTNWLLEGLGGEAFVFFYCRKSYESLSLDWVTMDIEYIG
jgi:hypothetical protein